MTASRPELPAYSGNYGTGQPHGTLYNGAATGYLSANGYGTGGQNGNGHNGNGHNGNGHGYPARDQHDVLGGHGTTDYQNPAYQDVDYQQTPSATGGYAPQNQNAGQFDERGYGVPDLAYGPDGYRGYPGYGPGSR